MCQTLVTTDKDYLAALTQWKTAGLGVDSGQTDLLMTNNNALQDSKLIQSVVRDSNGEASRIVSKAVRGSA